MSSKPKYTKKQVAVGAVLAASIALNTYLLFNSGSKTTAPLMTMAQNSSDGFDLSDKYEVNISVHFLAMG
jgi:hypothetical protein